MKKAFTLAEVLITLGIIGTIAALTMPALVKHTGSAEIGPKLAKFSNTVETAFQEMLNEGGVDTITALSSDANTLMQNLSRHMIMTPDMSGNSYNCYVEGNNNAVKTFENNIWLTKDGSLIYYETSNNIVLNRNLEKGPYKGIIGSLYYDIDGRHGTNNVGEEVFRFDVDNSGTLVPYGSNADKYLNEVERPECAYNYTAYSESTRESMRNNECRYAMQELLLPSGESVGWTSDVNGCIDRAEKLMNFEAACACTGKIADNNWKTD